MTTTLGPGTAFDDSDPFFGTEEDPSVILAQAIERRLDTRRGTLPSAPEYGLRLRDYLLAPITADQLDRIPLEVQAQVELEEDVDHASVTASVTRDAPGGVALKLSILVTLKSGPDVQLDLTVDAVDLTLELVKRG